MTSSAVDPFDFRARLVSGERMFGTFLKLPTTQVIEILGAVGYDFVIIDQEHSPLDRATTDLMILAARAANVAPLVRIAEFTNAGVLSVLDAGACGVMVPHTNSVEKAREIAASCRYVGGTRGYAGMTRASGWGRLTQAEHIAAQDGRIACIAMIEDLEAIGIAGEIAAVEGIDAVFVGQGDLSAAMHGEADVKRRVAEIVETVAAAAAKAGTPLMMIPAGPAEVEKARGMGANALVLSSDHGMIRSAAASALSAHRGD